VERILVYLGPSLPLEEAREILPEAIYRPAAKQGDILSDVMSLSPNMVILIDGEFRQNLSPWHKEIVYALQHPGVKAVYGAASMGALRAAELHFIGMVGVGKIFEWYRDGVTEDDAEVALSYALISRENGVSYIPHTVPLVDIRAALDGSDRSQEFFRIMQKIHYTDRTRKLCAEKWGGDDFPFFPQKRIDAIEVLSRFGSYNPQPIVEPKPEHLSNAFHALYQRDRRIPVNGKPILQQHLDSYIVLHNPEYERICWDSANQELALILCNALFVTVSIEEVESESRRFQQRCGVKTTEEFESMLLANGWTREEYKLLMIQNSRIHKLQHSLTVSKASRRNTQAMLNYMRTHQAFDYWAQLAAQKEEQIAAKGIDEWSDLDLATSPFSLLEEHFESEGLELKCSSEEYLLETGFSNMHEMTVALSRLSAAKE
jgi:hypothetical protein